MARVYISLEASPPSPPAGMVVIYSKPTGGVWVKDEYGNERQIDLEINDVGIGPRELWSAQKINSEVGTLQTNINNVQTNLTNHETSGTAHAAADITYDNSVSGLPATEVQGAIDAVAATAGGVYKSGIVPVGPQDGINSTFSLPGIEQYRLPSLAVYINGQQYDSANINKISPTTFQIINGDHLPDALAGDSFTISYMVL